MSGMLLACIGYTFQKLEFDVTRWELYCVSGSTAEQLCLEPNLFDITNKVCYISDYTVYITLLKLIL